MLDDARPMAFIATADPGRAKGFYGGTLGLELLEQTESALIYRLGPVQLRIAVVEKLKPSRHTVLGWDVPDLDAVLEELAHHGVSLERFPQLVQDRRGVWTAPGGDRVAWFRDTDGNLLSVSQRLGS
jgi:catechol 2,3-dioxygenase-like lactoylglutathione lyase family enzyme